MEKQLHLLTLCSNSPDYSFCEQLYLNAFPSSERRSVSQQRQVTDNEKLFHFCAIQIEGKTVGFLTYWDLDTFIYIEHFAVDESMRGQNMGSRTLAYLRKAITKPFILEVERPETEMARRRIGFYERNGYALWERDYYQPPYQEGHEYLPLHLMCNGALQEGNDFDHVKESLYKKVYGL